MKFKTDIEDRAEGFAFTDGTSADDVLNRIGSEYYEVEFKEDESEVYAYDSYVYKVTISIERA
ncbi:MAG TPA: hypothetical protein VIY48_01010 [Candidatus Paceibacterota bacterium]